jgi:hypothetical protein
VRYVKNPKTPQTKKTQSLKKDRRNGYGENSKSSRKNIPLSKRHTERSFRHATRQALASDFDENVKTHAALEDENRSLTDVRLKRLQGFHKTPDVPLAVNLVHKIKKRKTQK